MRYVLPLIGLSFALAGCDSLPIPDGVGSEACQTEESQGDMFATVGGDEFEACITTGQTTPANGLVVNGTAIAYEGGVPAGQSTLLLTMTISEAGTVELGSGDDQLAHTAGAADLKAYSTDEEGGSGTATITSVDGTRYQGTFSGTLLTEDGEEIEVTGGEFDVDLAE